MSIELRQAAQRALNALDEATTYTGSPSWSPSMTDECIAAASALRAALSQQPATTDPVGQVSDLFPSVRNKLHAKGFDSDAPLYTHPAPGVPDDSKRLDYLQDRGATIDLIPGVAGFYPMKFRVGGLRSSANTNVRAAIDAASVLTAAQAQKGQP